MVSLILTFYNYRVKLYFSKKNEKSPKRNPRGFEKWTTMGLSIFE